MPNKLMRMTTVSSLFLLVLLISACAPPVAKIKVSRTEVKPGDPVTVSWETKNAKKIEVNGEKVEKIGAKTVTPKQTTTYEVIARRGSKEVRDRAEITVTVVKPPMPTITLRAEPSAIDLGKNTMLRWQANNASTVTISGLGEVPASGQREVSPRVSTTYTATAIGEGGNATASTRVTVTDPAPPPPAPEKPKPAPEPPIAEQFRNQVRPVFFDYNKTDILPEGKEQLRRIADWLNLERNRQIVFRVEGYCDPRGTSEYNLGLGDRRSRAVKDFLISLGVDDSRIEIVSFGNEKALGTDEGAASAPPSWAHDRRAELIYVRGGER
jgi:peptidoglycan-associated lipoprotein